MSLRGTRRETCLQPRLLLPVPQSQNVCGSVRAKGLMGPERGKRPRGLKAGRRGGGDEGEAEPQKPLKGP